MSDYLSGYTDWSQAFADWTDVSISELHGIMMGMVCAIKPPTPEEWQLLLSELSFCLPSDEALQLLTQYGEDVAFALKDKDDAYEFTPLVPDDEHELGERFVALKQWAGGFITGVGMADMALSTDELEVLGDLSKIAGFRFDMDEILDEQTDDDDEDDQSLEMQYFELYEFARMVPVGLVRHQKKSVKELAIVKGLDVNRKTANESQKPLPFVVDATHKH